MALYLGYWPRIRQPRTFNEKIAHRQLLEYDSRFQDLTDKWRVREYVAYIVGKQFLSEVLAVVSSPADLELEDLPERFVAKPNHLSGEIYFVSHKNSLDRKEFDRTLNGWISSTHGTFHGEYWYAQIPPRIIIEEWLSQEGHDAVLDFKLYVFHGRVEVVQVDLDRFAHHTKNFYSREWQQLPFSHNYPSNHEAELEKPQGLPEMISVAEALGRDFDFVRVDLYCLDGSRIVFGEMTFNPVSGYGRFTPRNYDFEFGKLW